MAVFSADWAVMTGGSGNIAFTSMWFHSEMNIAFMDRPRIEQWVAQLWSEHLGIPVVQALELIAKPADAFNFFKAQADHNRTLVLQNGEAPVGRVFYKQGTQFPPRRLEGIASSEMAEAAKAANSAGQ